MAFSDLHEHPTGETRVTYTVEIGNAVQNCSVRIPCRRSAPHTQPNGSRHSLVESERTAAAGIERQRREFRVFVHPRLPEVAARRVWREAARVPDEVDQPRPPPHSSFSIPP